MSGLRRRAAVVAAAVFAALAGSVSTQAQVPILDAQPVQACEDPTKSMSLFAENLGKGRMGYGTTPNNASIPGPTIEIMEGDCLQVTLVNDTKVKLSMHSHGVAYTTQSDGTPLNKSCVAPGRSRTYVFSAPAPATRTDGTTDPGSAGYWHYHDHCVGTPHGTGGVKAGLFGAFIVRRPGDPVPDRPPFVVVFKNITINGKKSPHTPTFTANAGERVEFVVITHGEFFHTFHLHGHRWVDNRTGLPTGLNDNAQTIDNRTVGPADSFGFQVIAGEHVGPGAWMYHCHVQGHSDAGMSGLFIVKTAEGALTKETRETIKRFREMHHAHHMG
jgi:FtsP/CotA-like multicopper oxidase with cupredoxin domain